MKTTNPNILSASTLSKTHVVNASGEDLGQIKDFMLDLDDGCAVYAVLSFGGHMGFGDKLFAIPFRALEVDTSRERFILNVDKERLENAPGFDENNWPTTPDTDFINRVHTHYGYDAYYREDGSRATRGTASTGTGDHQRSERRHTTDGHHATDGHHRDGHRHDGPDEEHTPRHSATGASDTDDRMRDRLASEKREKKGMKEPDRKGYGYQISDN